MSQGTRTARGAKAQNQAERQAEDSDDDNQRVSKRARIAAVADDLNVCEEAAGLAHLIEESSQNPVSPSVASPASRRYMKYLVKEFKLHKDWPLSKLMDLFANQDSTSAAIDEVLDDMKGTLPYFVFKFLLWQRQ